MIKKLTGFVFAACLLLTWGCQPKKKGAFSVSGTFRNGDKLASVEGPASKVYLIVVSSKEQNPVVLDSAKLPHGSGSFSLSGLSQGETLYELVFGENIISVPLINDVAEVHVDVDLGKKDDFYDVKGSEASSQMKEMITAFGKKNNDVERLMADLDSLKGANAPDSLLIAGTNKKNDAIHDLNNYLKGFLNTNSNGTVSALTLSFASRSLSRSEFETSLNDLLRKFPDNSLLAGLKKSYDKQVSAMQSQDSETNSWVGKQAPELSLPDVNGKDVSIDSYKGKYLLVDFWASWCGPCRAENPNVVSVYNEFKGKNFAILGVSLDRQRDAWQEAIRADHLDWTHVSDLKFWSSKAVETFKFNGIPFNVLIDPKGKVIAQGLRGEDLEKTLRTVLN
jgi:peroxiredoxin